MGRSSRVSCLDRPRGSSYQGEAHDQGVPQLIVAAAVFFLVVKPMNALLERVKRGDVPAAEEVLPPTWEYRTAAEGELNRLGAEGWELVGVSTGGFHLKRPLTR